MHRLRCRRGLSEPALYELLLSTQEEFEAALRRMRATDLKARRVSLRLMRSRGRHLDTATVVEQLAVGSARTA